MEKLQTYLKTLRTSIPGLVIKEAVPDQVGQYNDVLLVNNTYIFRFPRYKQGIQVLAREAVILNAIKNSVPMAVPDFIYCEIEGRSLGEVFIGYKIIPGTLFWKETLQSVQDEGTIGRIADQLAGFLHCLHSIPPERLPSDMPLSGTREEWETLYHEFRELLFPFMRPDARDWTTAHFEAYLDDPNRYEFDPCIIHGDFGPSNLIYDPQQRRLCGVIDFGFSGLGDPAQDIAAVRCFGDAYVQHYAASYPEIEALYPRARFIKGTFALYEALHGLKNNDREAFESGIAAYR